MIVDSIVRRFRNTTYRNPDQWFLDWFNGGQESDSGVYVNAHNAMQFSPYWQAISIISGDIGTIFCPLYRRLKEGTKHVGRERDTTHPSYRLMLHEWNDVMTADVGKEVVQSHALSWGNGRAVIVRDERMRPMALVPLLPDRTDTKVVDGQVFHVTRVGESQEPKFYADRDVLHIKGLGFDGIEGYSVASMARNSLGLGIAAEKHGSRTFKNFAIPPIVLETDTRVGPEDAKRLLADWERFHGGADNVGKTGLLHSGIKAHMLSMPNRDAQWLELRKFQRTEIAGWFNLPPHMLGDDSRVSYNSLEQENAKYLSGCLLRWFIRWQLECRRKLLTEREKAADSHYFEFLADMLVSVDFAAKVEGVTKLIAATVMNPNEAREKFNMNHRPGGDKYENPNTSKGEAPAKPEPAAPPKKPKMPTPEAIAGVLLPQMAADERFRGPQGERGERGQDGTPGIQGEVGPQGEPGRDGRDGVDGKDGRDGIDGKDGERGPQGEPGEPSFYGRCLDVLSYAMEREIEIVRYYAANSKNFTARFQRWYPTWEKKLQADLERLGADASMAGEHCTESQRQLMELTEKTTMSTLVADVEKLTSAWHERGVRLARRLAGNDRPLLALEVETIVSTPHGLGKITAIESGWRYQVELQDGSTLPVDGKDLEVLG